MSRVAPDRAPARRIPVDRWPKQAEQLLTELADSVRTAGTELIVLAGDPRAAFVRLKDGPPRRLDPGRALLEADLRPLLSGRLSARDRQQLEAFRAQHAGHGDDGEGLAATVTALQRRQARAVLINRPPPTGRLWVGSEPVQVGIVVDREEAPFQDGLAVLLRYSDT